MAKETKKPAAAQPAPGDKLNKARAEFEKYRQRMQATEPPRPATPRGPGMPMGPALPINGAFPGASIAGAVPSWPAQPAHPFSQGLPLMPPLQSGAPFFQNGPAPFTGSGPFFESLGKMLQMGVAFATTAFAGGTQMLQGFSGMPYGRESGHGGHNGCCGDGHHDDCCDDNHGHHDSCCEPHHECCCNPGLNNCDCC
jgi:hypothetical protein